MSDRQQTLAPGTPVTFQPIPRAAVSSIVAAILLHTGNGEVNEDRIVWAALTADTITKCAGYGDA